MESAKEVGIKEASRIAGVHYTTVYEWRNRLEALGRDGFLSYCSESWGRGIKQVTEVQERPYTIIMSLWLTFSKEERSDFEGERADSRQD